MSNLISIDCISRAVAIDAINHVVIKFPGLLTRKQQTTVIETMTLTKNAIENALIKLPSVKPELVTDNGGGVPTVTVDACGIKDDTIERLWYVSRYL